MQESAAHVLDNSQTPLHDDQMLGFVGEKILSLLDVTNPFVTVKTDGKPDRKVRQPMPWKDAVLTVLRSEALGNGSSVPLSAIYCDIDPSTRRKSFIEEHIVNQVDHLLKSNGTSIQEFVSRGFIKPAKDQLKEDGTLKDDAVLTLNATFDLQKMGLFSKLVDLAKHPRIEVSAKDAELEFMRARESTSEIAA